MRHQSRSSTFTKILWQSFAALLLSGLVFVIYVYSEKQIDRANELRLQSFILADELRHSSDDLTRMVRTYAATGNRIYKERYQEILDIRNGKKARPLDYQNIYWDLIGTDDKRPRAYSDQSIPLIDMMRKAGFTDDEFAKLSEAKDNSDALTKIEFAAMELLEMKGSAQEILRNKQKALEMLYDKRYHDFKASIMRPIEEFYVMMKKRTDTAVHHAKRVALYLRILFIFTGIFLLFMLWRLHKTLYLILGSDADTLYQHISRIGKGDFSIDITVKEELRESVLGWLKETQSKLKEMMASNQRLTQLYAALSQCNQAIVRCTSEEELFTTICRNAVTFGGMKMATISMMDKEKQQIRPVAFYGEGTDYFNKAVISSDPNDPLGQGPTGRAYHENRPVWCQNFLNDPITAPWHENGKKYGFGSSAALPLHRNSEIVGVFSMYAQETEAFDEPVRRLVKEMVLDISYALESFARDRAREKAENALSESNNLLKSIIDTAPVRIFWKDRELNYLGCNKIFANDAGEADQSTVIGKNDTQLCWREQAALYQADDRRVMESGVPKLFYEEPQTTPEGDVIWLSTSKIPLFDKKHNVIGILGIYEDMTLRKNMELSLEREKNTAQNYLDIVGVMIMVLDMDNKVKLINRRGCEILGYSADEIIGKEWMENFIPQRFKDKVHEIADSLSKPDASRITYFENPILTKEGEERIIAWSNTPLFDADGETIGVLTSGEDITDRLAAEERSRYLANYDSLTGLPNRAYLDGYIKYTLNLAKRNNETVSVMFLDLDRFKDVNDTLGHNVGDKLLIESAKRLKSILREEDTVARLGGDEFIILLPNIDMGGADKVAQKLLETMKRAFQIGSHELSLTASVGIALYPNDGESFEVLYKNADSAMYRAKQEGRNGYCFFTEEMQKHSVRNLELSNALRHCIEQNQLELYYQPQISSTDGKIIGAEALLRWHHPELGLVSPAEFIPVAEENGLILPIGEWVLHTAAKQAKEWMDKGAEPIIMAVNLSAVQFRHLSLPETVSNILKEVALPPEYLEIELTESAAMHDPKKAIGIMDDLHNLGVRMSIDDFGTGYSSLSYLKKFKIYKLKIDQSFIRDINIDKEDKAIVGAIISMAKSLGLQTIAEGVETVGQLEYLKEQGCNELQGYFYSKPLPKREFEAFRTRDLSDIR